MNRLIRFATLVFAAGLLFVSSVQAEDTKPRVAILVYDGVQVIDHAVPFEVFGQFSLNEVYTVAKDSGRVTTYMGMTVLPNFTFADAPEPDVLVLPGGDTGDARNDAETIEWVRHTAEVADHILTICTGVFFLEGSEMLDGHRLTTWYGMQDNLRRIAPGAEVIGTQTVVESGKIVSAASLGLEGSLRVLSRLHGESWAEVVRLNMEYQPVPDSLRIPRVKLADLKLPDGVYSVFPWRASQLLKYEGDRSEWTMTWRFGTSEGLDSLRTNFLGSLSREPGWNLVSEKTGNSEWIGLWCIDELDGHDWMGRTTLRFRKDQVTFDTHVESSENSCTSAGKS